MLITIPFGIVAMAWGKFAGQIFAGILDASPNKKFINYGLIEQTIDLIPNFICTLIMFVLVYIINLIEMNILLKLIIQVLVGVTVYILCSWLMHLDSFEYVKNRLCKKP